jgi:hypothetical protein
MKTVPRQHGKTRETLEQIRELIQDGQSVLYVTHDGPISITTEEQVDRLEQKLCPKMVSIPSCHPMFWDEKETSLIASPPSNPPTMEEVIQRGLIYRPVDLESDPHWWVKNL